jgi:vanillate O-demethylase ferredoxin subunit
MLKAFETAAGGLPPERVHVEYFSADAPVADGGFEVVLARTGRTVKIPHNKTILETLLAEGMSLPRSCMEGVCGTCETVVLEGVPDHRDQVLSQRERRSNRKMIICRSGCIGDRLVLDL